MVRGECTVWQLLHELCASEAMKHEHRECCIRPQVYTLHAIIATVQECNRIINCFIEVYYRFI